MKRIINYLAELSMYIAAMAGVLALTILGITVFFVFGPLIIGLLILVSPIAFIYYALSGTQKTSAPRGYFD